MHIPFPRLTSLALAAALLCAGAVQAADPPSRVARLGYIAGAVGFSPAGEDDWDRAAINRPLTPGDRLWAEPGGRAEVQLGAAMVRLDAGTAVTLLNLDDRIAQLQLTQGRLNVHVRRLEPGQAVEVDTPNLAFTLRQPGDYRIDVDPDTPSTTITMRQGQGEAYGETAAYVIDAQQPYRFFGTGLRDFELVDTARPDDFDRWASARDRAYDTSPSARYVSPDVVGYQDLDEHGSWRVDARYGNVWTPRRVAADWAPYRDGHWAWVDPWGWTWIDDAPWGYAVSHYGRWANLGGTWAWVPGPPRTRAYYAPALVAFIGGDNFRISLSLGGGDVGGVAWVPLAPREVYRPVYPVSRNYYENLNRSNTVINNTVIQNTYNTTNITQVVYANRTVPGAVVAVPRAAFEQSKPVAKAVVKVSREVSATAVAATAPSVMPTRQNVHGNTDKAEAPPARAFGRPVVAHTAPPAARADFAAQEPVLKARSGQPLDDEARRALKPAAVVPVVKVVAPSAPVRRDPAAAASAPARAAPAQAEDAPATPARRPEIAASTPARAAPAQADGGPVAPARRAAPPTRDENPAPPAPRREPGGGPARSTVPMAPGDAASQGGPGTRPTGRLRDEPVRAPVPARRAASPPEPGASSARQNDGRPGSTVDAERPRGKPVPKPD